MGWSRGGREQQKEAGPHMKPGIDFKNYKKKIFEQFDFIELFGKNVSVFQRYLLSIQMKGDNVSTSIQRVRKKKKTYIHT